MIFLTEKSIHQNIKKFGFTETNSQVIELLNKCLINFTNQSIKKALTQHKKIIKQNGGSGAVGRTVLPSEYFGINSGSYSPNSSGTNMNVNNSLIRPAILTHDLSGKITGGKGKNIHGGSGAHGHTVLPSEYYGVNSGSYFENLKGLNIGTNMNVTNSMIRPAILTHDISGSIKGGAVKQFSISKSAFKNALNEARIKYQNNISIPQETVLELQHKFEQLMTEVLLKTEKKSGNQNLQSSHLHEILQQRKYNILKN